MVVIAVQFVYYTGFSLRFPGLLLPEQVVPNAQNQTLEGSEGKGGGCVSSVVSLLYWFVSLFTGDFLSNLITVVPLRSK